MTILILGNVNHEYSDVGCTYDLEQIPWKLEVASEPSATYGIEVATTVESIHGMAVSHDIESSYKIKDFLVADPSITYGIKVEADLESKHSIRVESDVELVYSVGSVHKDLVGLYSIRGNVYGDVLSTYGINLHYSYGDIESISATKVECDIESSYSIREQINNDVNFVYNLATWLEYDIISKYNVSTYNLVYKDVRGVYMLYSPTSETIVTNVLVTVNDE